MNDHINIIKAPAKMQFPIRAGKVHVSEETQCKIEQHWQEINKDNTFFRGTLYRMDDIKLTADELTIGMKETEYAHHLYAKNNRLSKEEACPILAPVAFVVSSDGYLLFGRMGGQTAKPGVIQCAGGGIDQEDVSLNEIDVVSNVTREVEEELGINVKDDHEAKAFFADKLVFPDRMGWLAIVFQLHSTFTRDQLVKRVNRHNEQLRNKGEIPEFEEVITVKNIPSDIGQFLQEHHKELIRYLRPLLYNML
ncbi:NUDIX hydrolase [Geomicrobium sp. JCM 19038]|uniref:NUDIX hydrolase n=1 Tax=Geomicrobium sp. JCM 19038 TaxID=1460635 RepID=UPI00045F17EC|nr:hypothetical protein [Geomicrobium sp. JCM 19038]GAK07658.1 hypothetical protein JCM19038_1400 [Geomicrobium sp. JCM 19038]